MKNILKKALIVIIVALAIYGAYSATKDLKSYLSFKIKYSRIVKKENIRTGISKMPNLKLIDTDGNALNIYDDIKCHEYVILSLGSI